MPSPDTFNREGGGEVSNPRTRSTGKGGELGTVALQCSVNPSSKHSSKIFQRIFLTMIVRLAASISSVWAISVARDFSVPLGMSTLPWALLRWAIVKYTRSTLASVWPSGGLMKLGEEIENYWGFKGSNLGFNAATTACSAFSLPHLVLPRPPCWNIEMCFIVDVGALPKERMMRTKDLTTRMSQ